MGRVTAKTLANELGLARSTVTMALRDHPLIKDETKRRVQQAARRHSYVPNSIARSLVTNRTHTIGLVVPSTLIVPHLAILRSVLDHARDAGYLGLADYTDSTPASEAVCVERLRGRMVDGFLALSPTLPGPQDHFAALVKDRVPLVSISPLIGVESDSVRVNLQSGFRRLTRHLIEQGHRRIGLIQIATGSWHSKVRDQVYREAMTEAGLEIDERWVVGVDVEASLAAASAGTEPPPRRGTTIHCGYYGAQQLFGTAEHRQDLPTALVCGSDEVALGVLDAARSWGLAVPDDLALVGFDNLDISRHVDVPLTTMHQREDAVARAVVDLLLRRIDGDWSDHPKTEIIEPELVVRKSSVKGS